MAKKMSSESRRNSPAVPVEKMLRVASVLVACSSDARSL